MSPLELVTFFTVVLLFYYLLPRKWQPSILLVANIFYCITQSLLCLVSVIGVTVTTFFAAFSIERKRCRRTLAVGVALVLSSFVLNKLTALFESSSVLFRGGESAQGLAFYSFSAVGYLVDLYRGKIKREKSFLRLFLFVGFFPCLRLGPISRYSDLSPQLSRAHAPSWENITLGALRVSWGYFKKLVIADTALVALRTIVAEPQKFGGGYALFLIILYSVVIYADFTGGIDIALGIGRALGISLAENFDRPFASESVREYWKRWHITLGAFFSDYVFYPVSVSRLMQRLSRRLRGGKFKKLGRKIPIYLALLLTWLLTGAWHGLGINFILWGLANAAVIIVAQELSRTFWRFHKKHPSLKASKAWHCLVAVRTFFIIGAIRLFDLWGDAVSAPRAVLSIFFDLDGWRHFFFGGILALGLSLAEWVVLALAVALVCIVNKVRARQGDMARNFAEKKPLAALLCIVFLVLSSLIFGSYGVGFEESSFIYSQF